MKGLFLIGAVVAVALVTALWSCAKSKPAQAPSVPAEPRENVAIADSDSVVAFDYKRRVVDNGVLRFESCSWARTDGRVRFHHCPLGSREGMMLYNVDGQAALDSLTAALRDTPWQQFPFAPLSEHDYNDNCWPGSNDNCWMVHIKLLSGGEISVACDTETPRAALDIALGELTRRLVERQLAVNEAAALESEFSELSYKPDGNLSQRIDFLPDGTVKGGFDPDAPLNAF